MAKLLYLNAYVNIYGSTILGTGYCESLEEFNNLKKYSDENIKIFKVFYIKRENIFIYGYIIITDIYDEYMKFKFYSNDMVIMEKD